MVVFLGPPCERLAVFPVFEVSLLSSFRSKVQRRCVSASPFSSLNTAAPTQHLSEGQHVSGTGVCLELGLDFPHMDG